MYAPPFVNHSKIHIENANIHIMVHAYVFFDTISGETRCKYIGPMLANRLSASDLDLISTYLAVECLKVRTVLVNT
jgi:hypothetical protein